MSNQTDIIEVPPTELEIVISNSGLERSSALVIAEKMTPFLVQAQQWPAQVALVTDPKIARASRLALRKIRCDAENTRKALKADAVKFGKALDAAYQVIENATAPLEARLEEVETKAEREEQARRDAIKASRMTLLAPYGTDTQWMDLASMPDAQFQKLLSDAKFTHQSKIEAAAKAEVDRVAKEKAEADAKAAREKAEADERERVRQENIRLAAEAEAARIEKEKAEAAVRAEREAAAKAVREAEAKAQAERDAIQAKAAEDARQERLREQAAREVERQRVEAEKAETARLAKIEADKLAAQAKAEQDRLAEIARKEREAREKMEAEQRAAHKAEEARKRAEAEAARKVANAPDRDKLIAFAKAVDEAMPQVHNESLNIRLQTLVHEFIQQLKAESESL